MVLASGFMLRRHGVLDASLIIIATGHKPLVILTKNLCERNTYVNARRFTIDSPDYYRR